MTTRRATTITAQLFGLLTGFGGLEHGYFEILQGNIRPESLMFAAFGPPCVPEATWHACEPAMTILPSLWVTGILAIVFGLVTMVWAAFFVERHRGGLFVILLSAALLLIGGGIFPPVIGIIGGAVGIKIHTPIKRAPTPFWSTMAKAWPWAPVLFLAWSFGQFVLGYYFNAFLLRNALIIPILVFGLLALSILASHGQDVVDWGRAGG
jgi:hypothetical protein